MLSFLKRYWGWFLLSAILTWYGHYVGKTNADLWWQANGRPKRIDHALIVRSQYDVPVGRPCTVNVGYNEVLTITADGHVDRNTTGAKADNCNFQWVITEVWK
jgi:hypothetical protein